MNRRYFLQGIGGALLAAPYLTTLGGKAARAADEKIRRVVVYFTHNGCLLKNMQTSPANGPLEPAGFKTLAPLADLAPKMLQIRGLSMFPQGQITYNGVQYFDPHDQGTGSKFTCAPIDGAGSHWAQGVSFDWFLAPQVNRGADKSPLVMSPTSGFANVKTVLSYKVAGDGEAFKPETNVGKVYSSLTGLFVNTTMDNPVSEADYRVLRGNSVLDVARDDLKAFQALNMSKVDKQRVQAWMDLLVTTEKQVVPGQCNATQAGLLGISDTAIKAAGGTVASTTTTTGMRPAGGAGSFSSASTATQMTLGMDMLHNLFALTLICDANRVLVQHNQSFVVFTWDGMTFDVDHHGISHRTGSAAVTGVDAAKYEPMIEQIDTWYGQKYASLVKKLDSIPEGDGTLLDSTATVWLPELGDGMSHNNTDLPITIMGGMGGYLKKGVSVDTRPATTTTTGMRPAGGGGFGGATGTPLNQLYVTLMNGMGVAGDSFGMLDSNDTTLGITKPGALKAIEAG